MPEDPEVTWLAHGAYRFEGEEEALEVFEVGRRDRAPLTAPGPLSGVERAVAIGDEHVLGWRPAPGQPIPRRPHWTLQARLGVGGFGEVWRAVHKSGERRVFKFCFDPKHLRALKREVTLLRLIKEALGHREDIVRVIDWSFEAAPYFTETELTEGGDLTRWAASRGGFSAIAMTDRLRLIAEAAEALAAAHSVGILHKDVKPQNILVFSDAQQVEHARLTDFGIGQLTQPERLEAGEVTAMGFTKTEALGEASSAGRSVTSPPRSSKASLLARQPSVLS